MKIYVAEKASVGRALAAALTGEQEKCEPFIKVDSDIVAWAAGHLLELCMPEDYDERYKQWGANTLLYVPSAWRRKEMTTAKKLLGPLKKLIKGLDPKVDIIVNAGDADREGQLLIDEILDFYGWKGQTLRLRINDMNAPAIRKALENMKDNAEYRGEYMAGQARLYADWLVGLPLTRFVTVSLRNAGYDTAVKSVGRVQAPTLGLVVARDAEITNFTPKPYWELRAVLSLDGGRQLTGKWVANEKSADFLDDQKRIIDRNSGENLLSRLDGQNGKISKVEKKAHRKAPPLPFSLSKLQMAASKKCDITDTLTHLQKLYEAGYVTYPRTDCEYLPEGHYKEAGGVVDAIRVGCPDMGDMLSGVDLSRKSTAWNDAKVSEHHGIIPTVRVPLPDALTATERKIYELVCARYIMQFFADYEYEETVIEFGVGEEACERFKATGRTVINIGWQGWDGNAKKEGKNQKKSDIEERACEDNADADEVQTLPQVREGETGSVQAALDEKITKPPKPYTYHGLIQDMNNIHNFVHDADIKAKLKEIHGIGTSATQENVIATLFSRGYLEKKKKAILPTDLGKCLISILGDSRASMIVKPDMTALWEQKMSEIEHGAAFEPFIEEVAGMVREIIAEPLKIPNDIPGMDRLEKCMSADCDGFLRHIEKKDKQSFFACPACRATFNDVDGKPVRKVRRQESGGETVEAPCPLGCGGSARRFSGKYGYFWKCSCSQDITFKDAEGKPAVKEAQIKADCPVEGCKGEAIQLRGKNNGQLFWLCSTCGNFFDEVEGRPVIRKAKGRKSK